jgi:hypothetical protein
LNILGDEMRRPGIIAGLLFLLFFLVHAENGVRKKGKNPAGSLIIE